MIKLKYSFSTKVINYLEIIKCLAHLVQKPVKIEQEKKPYEVRIIAGEDCLGNSRPATAPIPKIREASRASTPTRRKRNVSARPSSSPKQARRDALELLQRELLAKEEADAASAQLAREAAAAAVGHEVTMAFNPLKPSVFAASLYSEQSNLTRRQSTIASIDVLTSALAATAFVSGRTSGGGFSSPLGTPNKNQKRFEPFHLPMKHSTRIALKDYLPNRAAFPLCLQLGR